MSLGSTSAWPCPKLWSPAQECTGAHQGLWYSPEPWGQPTTQNAPALCQEEHFGRSATQKADRKNILPGIMSVFQKLDINSAAPILLTKYLLSLGLQNGKTNWHRNTSWDYVFHHNYTKLEMCTGCPQALRLLQLFISSSTGLTSSHLAHSSFLKFDHSSLPIHLQVFLVTQKWVLKTKEVSVPNTSWLTHVT